jgi:flagellar biosynthesis protein FlhF
MEYFTIQGRNHWEVIEKMKAQYGSTARILTRKNIRYGGILGFFGREGVEISGYLSAGQAAVKTTALEEEKKKILEGVKREQTMQQILEEIQSLKDKMAAPSRVAEELHPTIGRIKECLEINEFSASYIQKIVERIRIEFSLDKLEDFTSVQEAVINWIGEGISIYSRTSTEVKKPHILIVIGPTGVGKTTTIAKLAAIYGLGNGDSQGLNVRMITIDNYRIAARKQIETYAEIMQIPISCAESRSELAKMINLYQDVDIILVDTIGKSPNDFNKLGEMKSILNACGILGETHLAVSATTKTSDVEEVFRHFEPFNYSSIILTKLDETTRIGNIISILSEHKKSLSYITDGQQVPQDIEPASVSRLLLGLEGFQVDREQIESKFSRKDVDTLNGWSM